MKKIKLDIHSVLMSLVLFSPIAMLVQKQFDAVNRVVVGGILICLVLVLRNQLKVKTFITIFFTAVLFGYSLLNINQRYFSVNQLFYFPMWVCYLLYTIDSYDNMVESFRKCENFTRGVIWMWSILVLISFALPSSYSYPNGDFHSFAQGNFRFAPTVFFMGALIWTYSGFFQKKKYMIFMLIPFVAMVATGSRTYTIIMLVMIALAFYNFFEKKQYFWLMLIPCVLLVIDVLAGSQFILKFQRAMNNKYVDDSLAAMTSNRSVFWSGELQLFKQAGIIEKLFGGGLTSSYVKNVYLTGQAIWAHNDFLEALNAHGLVGLLLYLYCFFKAYIFYKRKYKFTFIQMITFLFCLLFNAFFNGLYVYTTAMLSIPFLAYAVTLDFGLLRLKDEKEV